MAWGGARQQIRSAKRSRRASRVIAEVGHKSPYTFVPANLPSRVVLNVAGQHVDSHLQAALTPLSNGSASVA